VDVVYVAVGADLNMSDQHIQGVVQEAAKVVPAVVGATYSFLGMPLHEWAAIITIVYTCFMGYLAFRDRVYRPWRTGKVSRTPSDYR
jgi:predicted membrane metal-binding protein